MDIHCAEGVCINNCEGIKECGAGKRTCPLNEEQSSLRSACGTNSGLCSRSEPQRPSCSADSHKLKRVVGYYEEWSKERPCNQISPEQIPAGVYTHLNFAFARIDPKSYKLQANISDYEGLTSLKKRDRDRDLKVFIAVGGFSSNKPDSAATIFSNMVASPEKSDIFISSVVDFVNSHGFDGIDLDWEYPGAQDRGGRAEDYVNFPNFVEKLKKALRKTDGRDGISITLPSSSGYLSHFDIKALELHVDHFNMMTYDLHGTWDQQDNPYLNAHTNLTEAKQAMDLLWHKGIIPDKIALGLAFYGKTYIMQDPDACHEPGCRYVSGGAAAPCSNEDGVMLNSEIEQVISNTSVSPRLYEDAAVKILSYNHDHWVSFDDEETLKMRIDFAKSQCLGGVMVWAVSQDASDGRYSLAVGRAATTADADADNVSMFMPGPIEAKVYEAEKPDDKECKWTNCLERCPKGLLRTKLNESDAHDGKDMSDAEYCQGQGKLQLCCPPKQSRAFTQRKRRYNVWIAGVIILGWDGSVTSACLIAAGFITLKM
uniref:chitinase n=1 Tax=Hypocrella siamensis TaxID=696354 RepID=A0A0P0CJB9_9HYPO